MNRLFQYSADRSSTRTTPRVLGAWTNWSPPITMPTCEAPGTGAERGQQILANIAQIIPLSKQGSLLRAIAHNQAQTVVLGVNQLTTGMFRALERFAQKSFAEAERERLIAERLVEDELAPLVGRASLEQFLVPGGFIRRIVATVDNLARSKAPQKMWPVKPAGGRFVTSGDKDDVQLSPENDRRYDPALRFMESVDSGKLVALYVRLYPLFQQAYKELGYPNKHFNDRLVEVIDHLLATPDVKGPISLKKPWVMYEFADPALEARSAGQKTLIRIGPENVARVKAKLRDVRRQVTRQPPPQ